MNKFKQVCPGCGTLYRDVIENGVTKLLHSNLLSTFDRTKLPTSKCIRYHDYVVFDPCGHCCPDIFADCRPCKLGYEGAIEEPSIPTQEECKCHYCIPELEPEIVSTGESSARIFQHTASLHRQLVKYFDFEGLRTICLYMNIDYENFVTRKDGFARELIEFCQRNALIQKLLDFCKEMRPDLSWSW